MACRISRPGWMGRLLWTGWSDPWRIEGSKPGDAHLFRSKLLAKDVNNGTPMLIPLDSVHTLVVVQQPRTVLTKTAADGTATTEVHLIDAASDMVAEGLAAFGRATTGNAARAHSGAGAQQQSASDHHDFEEVRDHFQFPLGWRHGRTTLWKRA